MKATFYKYYDGIMIGLACWLIAGFGFSAFSLYDMIVPTVLFFILANLDNPVFHGKKEKTTQL